MDYKGMLPEHWRNIQKGKAEMPPMSEKMRLSVQEEKASLRETLYYHWIVFTEANNDESPGFCQTHCCCEKDLGRWPHLGAAIESWAKHVEALVIPSGTEF